MSDWFMKFGVHWIRVPFWAKYVAQDEDGVWHWFAAKPHVEYYDRGLWVYGPACCRTGIGYKSEPPKDFTQELYKIIRS